jgi:hypothetical protein
MLTRLVLVGALAVALVACGGGSPPTPAGQASTPAAPGATVAPGGGGGSTESIVQALVPPGATQQNHATVGNLVTVVVSTTSSLNDLQAFFDAKIPSLGLTQTGKFNVQDSVTYAFANPEGGIVIAADGNGGYLVTISAGTSS